MLTKCSERQHAVGGGIWWHWNLRTLPKDAAFFFSHRYYRVERPLRIELHIDFVEVLRQTACLSQPFSLAERSCGLKMTFGAGESNYGMWNDFLTYTPNLTHLKHESTIREEGNVASRVTIAYTEMTTILSCDLEGWWVAIWSCYLTFHKITS